MAELEFLLAGIPVLLSMFVPGLLLALPMLRNSRLSLFEKCIFGLIVGMVIPPFVLLLLSFVGIYYSFTVMLATLLAITVIGLLLNFTRILQGSLTYEVGAIKEVLDLDINLEKLSDLKRLAVWTVLVLIMLWALWARMQSLSPIFYEFDPYYYMLSTQWILTQGQIPAHDMTAWYPEGGSHRVAPLTNYLEAQWYSIYTQGGGFDLNTLTMVGNVYPPVVGALLCFLLFITVREEWGTIYGLAAAVLAAVLPRIIMKFAAGEAEIQPWGLFALFFFVAAYALMVYRRDRGLAILAGIAAMSVIVGSQYFIILMLVYGGYLGLQATLDFLRGRDLREFIELNAYVIAAIFIASAAMAIHLSYLRFLIDKPLILLGALAYGVALHYIHGRLKGAEEKGYAFLGLLTVGALILLFSPVGASVQTAITSAAGFATQTTPLFMTVAEESPTANEFQGAFDILGSTLFTIGGQPFTLIHLTLVLAAFAFAYGIWRDSKLALLLALLIFPISWVGIQKSKYVLQLGFMLILALMAVFGEPGRLLPKLFTFLDIKEGGAKSAAKLFMTACLLVLLAFVVLEPDFGTFKLKGSVVEITTVKYSPQYWNNDSSPNCNQIGTDGYSTAYYLYCDTIPPYWTDTMSWIRTNVENDTRVLSWWDYGHWTNYFGQKDTLTRGEHMNQTLDLMVADKYVFGPRDSEAAGEQDMAQFMRDYKTKYVLFDYDLVQKWGALDFLACVHNNQTSMEAAKAQGIGTSECEKEHNFEHVLIPVPSQRTASDYCASPIENVTLVRGRSTFGYTYCVGEDMQYGYPSPKFMVYEDNMTKQNKAVLISPQGMSFGGRDYAVYTAIYLKNDESMWGDNQSGWEDRKGKFYDSNFYKGFFLGELDGFDKVYEYREGGVGQPLIRIYAVQNYTS